MTPLEQEVEALHAQLKDLNDRVRLDAVAQAFLQNNHASRPGDFFLYGESPAKLYSLYDDNVHGFPNRWRVSCGSQSWDGPIHGEITDYQRLYTAAEVAEVVAKITRDVIMYIDVARIAAATNTERISGETLAQYITRALDALREHRNRT